jgi:hypothetical protein
MLSSPGGIGLVGMWSYATQEALSTHVLGSPHTPKNNGPWPAFATSHRSAVVGTPVIISVIHAIIRHYRRFMRPHVVRMPVKDAFASIGCVLSFFDNYWRAAGRKRAQPSHTTTHVVLIGSNYHFTLLVLHSDEQGATRISHFDPMLPEQAAETNTERLLRDWCTTKNLCHFYHTRCHWQQDGIHCGLYACAAVHTICMQIVQQRHLAPMWLPSTFGCHIPLQLRVGADNSQHMQASLRLSYAFLVTRHAQHLKRKLPGDFAEIEPPFKSRITCVSQPTTTPVNTVVDLVSDSD